MNTLKKLDIKIGDFLGDKGNHILEITSLWNFSMEHFEYYCSDNFDSGWRTNTNMGI